MIRRQDRPTILLTLLALFVAGLPASTREVLEPIKLSALVDKSDLIVVVRPIQITVKESSPFSEGVARVQPIRTLKGEPPTVPFGVQWSSDGSEIRIETLDEYLLFLRRAGEILYDETVRGRSRWRLRTPPFIGKAGEKCSAFVLLHSYPASTITIPSRLVRHTQLFSEDLPPPENRVKVDAVCIDDINRGLLADASALASGSILFEGLDSKSVYSGCGCAFWTTTLDSAEERTVVFSSNYENSARVRIAGSVRNLSAVRPDSACLPQVATVGDRCLLKYGNKNLTVTVNVQVTWVCPPTDESCELVQLQGEMKGTGIDPDRVVRVKGECGC